MASRKFAISAEIVLAAEKGAAKPDISRILMKN